MARTLGCKWAGVQSGQYFHRPLSFSRRSSICLGKLMASECGTQILTAYRFMFDKIMPLSDAVEGYDIFDKMKAQKVVFKAHSLPEAKSR
jgi:hypothetical protein